MSPVRNRLVGIGAVVALFAFTLTGVVSGVAQDATPAAGDGVAPPPRPAHIHTGTCAEVGEIVAPLADVGFRETTGGTPMAGMATPEVDMATPMAMDMTGMGSADAIPAAVSVTIVELSLEQILAADHIINVHESAEQIQNYIACGAIGGTPDEENSLYIGLAEQNDSGFSGVAWLRDNGDGTTYVTIFLTEGVEGGAATEVEATPAA